MPPPLKPEMLIEDENESRIMGALKLQVPFAINFILERLIEMINLIYIGHITSSAAMIGAIGLGNLLIAMLVLVVLLGLNSYNEVKISQAYAHKDIQLVSDYVCKGRIAGFIQFVCCAILISILKYFLVCIGVDPQLAYYVDIYLWVQIPAIFTMAQYEISRTLLLSTGFPEKTMYVIPITTSLHVLWGYLFIMYLDWGVVGASLATNLTFILNLIGINIIINKTPQISEANKIPSKKNFYGFSKYMKEALPAIIMRAVDAWGQIFTDLLAMLMSTVSAAVVAIAVNFFFICNTSSAPINGSLYILVSRQLAKRDISMAKKYLLYLTIEGLTICVILCTIMMSFPYFCVTIFTDLEEVVEAAAAFLSLCYPVYLLSHTIKFLLSSQFITLQKQKLGAISIYIFFFVGYPMGIVIGFVLGYGLNGLYIGLMIGNGLAVIFQLYYLLIKFDYDQICEEAADKLKEDQRRRQQAEEQFEDTQIQSNPMKDKLLDDDNNTVQ